MTPLGPSLLPPSDRALLLAFRAWRVPADQLPWKRIAPAWSAGLKAAWDREYAAIDPENAWSSLNRQHVAEAVFQVDHVHPSWLIRALQGESPAVVRAILAHGPDSRKALLGKAFGFDPQSLVPDGPTHPDALTWSQSFWAERLVGGPPLGPDDPPVILAIAGLALKDLARLMLTTGLTRLALAEKSADAEFLGRKSSQKRALFEAISADSEGLLDSWIGMAREDREANLRNGRPSSRNLGLLTLARLLSRSDPLRARWALQHLPYPIAKRLRAGTTIGDDLAVFELHLLRTSWRHLEAEGRIGRPWGGRP